MNFYAAAARPRAYVPPVSVVLAAERDRYIERLTRYRAGCVGEWIERFAWAAVRAANLARSYLRFSHGS